MDNTSQPLATESFSYSWLESQHKTIISNNNHSLLLDETTHNFDFNISNSKSNPSSLVHADKLFSNGLILPRSFDEPSSNASSINSIIASSSSSSPSPLLITSKIHHHPSSSSFRRIFLGKCSKFIPKKVFIKYIKCLIPMKESNGKGGTRVDDVNRLTWEFKSRSTNNNTPEVASPKKEIGAYSSTWSDIDESSIRDAILYCKRSSGLC